MLRVKFKKGEQRRFLIEAKKRTGGSAVELAKICCVHRRTLTGWLHEKYNMSQNAVKSIEENLQIIPPNGLKILPEHWNVAKASEIGAIARYEKYGNPGTPKGRKKGGQVSWAKQMMNGKECRLIKRKTIYIPKASAKLAEIVGAILGDGTISKFQISLAVSALVDREYANYLVALFEEVFRVSVVRQKERKNTIRLTISSRELVEYFNKMGLLIGDKIRNGTCIPEWILKEETYTKACLKGLFDTDGCVYYHRHFVRGREYNNIGWEFRNLNNNLLEIFHRFLLERGFRAKFKKERVSLYNRQDIRRYFKFFGSSNPKHVRRVDKYFQ